MIIGHACDLLGGCVESRRQHSLISIGRKRKRPSPLAGEGLIWISLGVVEFLILKFNDLQILVAFDQFVDDVESDTRVSNI